MKRVTVVVDAMGGDQAPQEIVVGAVAAARALPEVDIILVGDETVVRSHLSSISDVPANLSTHHASQVIDMCDAPGAAIRQKRDSSIAVGMRLVRDGKAQAIISAGNSGAMMAGAMLILKPQAGVDRPAIATLFPTMHGRVVLLDAGATTDCKPAHLVQFARLGNAYAKAMFDCQSPRVGLISIGEESSKGDELTKETHRLLLTTDDLHFVGNVEPKELVRGEVEVAVCDGFVGNLLLKAGEGVGELIMGIIKSEISQGWLSRLAALILRPAFRRVKRRFDYSEYGGALLLGVNGIVVIGHGRSNAYAIENAVKVAARASKGKVVQSASDPDNGLVNSLSQS
ncbi:MAG TPA: phosphate acyltransferase PlsX [Armatimonadota bacterium]|nr:phosphate acyltransferase PlsX [Armatimonadota bacterium]